jgi:ethanolamine ammonia-lyase large subunit
MMIGRRGFLWTLIGGATTAWSLKLAGLDGDTPLDTAARGVSISEISPDEDVFGYIRRVRGRFDATLYKQILGAANEHKEGDGTVGVAAADEVSRRRARSLLANTSVADIDAHPLLEDKLLAFIEQARDRVASASTQRLTMGELKTQLLAGTDEAIKAFMNGLSSSVIGSIVKLMSNRELIAVGAKVFNPLPGSQIGARGYLGARIQPNSPTDNLDDIRWQVLDGFAFAVGDVVVGTNPVSSEPASVEAIELALKDLLDTFGIADVVPHCVLSHIDVQAQVEKIRPGCTALWFQSLAGTDTANTTFDISVEKMLGYAAQRTGTFGLYFETGQGADFTNGSSHGFDMVLHESRKYGFARALKQKVAEAQVKAGRAAAPWVHLNDVAGFIGPEVFRTREQLVRCCLEDIVMGKLHGLPIGLDVCSTLHMDVSLDDLDWCLDQVAPANPAYLMALPTKNDPMLGYLTTSYQDHVRLREQHGLKVNDRMWKFFQEIEVVDAAGRPTAHFGDPAWVYLQFRRRKGDARTEREIRREAAAQLAEVRGRGVFIAEGHGTRVWDLEPNLAADIRRIYADAKKCIWAELDPGFIAHVPAGLKLATRSKDRTDYILHPETGESMNEASAAALRSLRERQAGAFDVQIVVSDGLDALAIMDEGHLAPYLARVRTLLVAAGFSPTAEHIVLTSGRVRAGYRIGEALFGGLDGHRAILHVIGERPGTGHHTFSVYITAPGGSVWGEAGRVDHNITKVVSGIAVTALQPVQGADDTVRLLKTLAR